MTALLDCYKPQPGGLAKRILNHPATHPGPRRDLVHAPSTVAVLADLVPDNAEHCQLADRELAGQARRHRTAGGEVAAPGNGDKASRSLLEPPGREDGRPAGGKAHQAYRLEITA
jgi:hypothetical protein